ncbi:Hypoxia-inducible factor 1 alpha [Nesidiocoris tenuis]|uniref:Hypoxia-inducible factor 1 alpha n=1 Tax=Nesidiocoris tenuis TaxID=355587 RepID=A0ABN7A735_9HEMI|nr:Hypoxia-inducible factor 1 alpha [Nesidiocoris tenuis]
MEESDDERRTWDENQIRKYDIKMKSVPKHSFVDPIVMEIMLEGRPVIITDSKMVEPAAKWNLKYLARHMGNTNCNVIVSKDHNFKYYDDKCVQKAVRAKFVPPHKKVTMKIGEFVDKIKEMSPGGERLYLQQALTHSVGTEIVKDFLQFKWDYIKGIQKEMGWGSLTSNLLLIGMEGNVTPCHYDEQENLFAQVKGYKRILLFPPEQFECLYPHPVWHPHDRQSQVDFDDPDLTKFPKFANAMAQEAIVGPGDVLFIPNYWFHHVESLQNGGYTVSVNFWYKSKSTGAVAYPLNATQKMAIMRNVEKMLVDALRDPDEVGPLLRNLTLGRYHDFSLPPESQ